MSGSGEKDEPLQQPPDTLAAALEPTRSHDDDNHPRSTASVHQTDDVKRPLADKEIDEIEQIGQRRADSMSDDNDIDEKGSRDSREQQQTRLAQTKSYATDTSAATGAAGNVEDLEREKSWYSRLNPLRWGKVPPVPDEPTVSREATAGFWSLLTFTWMGPIMSVRCQSINCLCVVHLFS